jgi:DNA-binding NarL/FixJ family response regulator
VGSRRQFVVRDAQLNVECLHPLALKSAPTEQVNPGGLSATEAHVLRLLASGRTTKEIAAELVIATSTADRHITHIYNKLGVRNRAEAVVLALKYGVT